MTATPETRETLGAFAARVGLTMTVRQSAKDYDSPPADWPDADHWRVTLMCGGKRFTVAFHQGYGHHGAEPTLEAVLDCLASDASGYENAHNFGEWCMDYGFDTDSRKAERTYRACGRIAANLGRLLGAEYDTLLYGTER